MSFIISLKIACADFGRCCFTRRVVTLFFLLCFMMKTWGTVCSAETTEQAFSIDAVKKAWAKRPKEISSFKYTYNVAEELVKFERETIRDPFGNSYAGVPSDSIHVEKQLTVKRQGRDMAICVDGDQCDIDNYEVFSQSFKSAFQGNAVRRLLSSSRGTHGLGAFGSRNTRLASTAMNVETGLVLMWYDPASLFEQYQIDLATARIVNDDVLGQQRDVCVELSVPRSSEVVTKLVVQKQFPYLPVEVASFRNNSPLTIYQLDYSQHQEYGTQLEAWRYQAFRNDGELIIEKRGKLVEFVLDRLIEKNAFSLKFPIGTRIVEFGDSDKRIEWIQTSENEMKRLAEVGQMKRTQSVQRDETK